MDNIYLSSSAMKATAHSLSLISNVTHFEIVELWTNYNHEGVRCVYVHATDKIMSIYPHIKPGHHPKRDITEHTISPGLCSMVTKEQTEDAKQCHWITVDSHGDQNSLYPDHILSVKTEMAYRLEADTGGLEVFIVALSPRLIPFTDQKLSFMSSLAYAVYIAAFSSVGDQQEASGGAGAHNDKELDTTNYPPHHTKEQPPTPPTSHSTDASDDYEQGSHKQHHHSQRESDGKHRNKESKKKVSSEVSDSKPAIPRLSAPTWEPALSFHYPVADMPVKYHVPDNLTLDNFSDVQHLADGSNSNVFLARLKGQQVVIKLIKEEVVDNPIVVQEFEQEYGMLARMDHPHVIKVLGAGQVPRPFIVLEHLGGGSLEDMLQLSQEKQSGSIASMLFRKPTFTYDSLLLRARSMAEALDYLHRLCHPGATIIHRDLKPDNVGFTSDGTLKLFDFGLMTCVKTRTTAKGTYDMTGCTGSLRYMAPEVALNYRYTEKVDVYSFGIMLWQMAKDRLPFQGLGKSEFYSNVVRGGQRPPLDKNWPSGFGSLLAHCWDSNPEARPNFGMIVVDIDKLISERKSSQPGGKSRSVSGAKRGVVKRANTLSTIGSSLGF